MNEEHEKVNYKDLGDQEIKSLEPDQMVFDEAVEDLSAVIVEIPKSRTRMFFVRLFNNVFKKDDE